MWFRSFLIAWVTLVVTCLLGCQGQGKQSALSPASNEILYVVDNANVTTYTIDPVTLAPSLVGDSVGLIPPSSFLLQFVPSPDDHFLYVLWSDTQQQEHLSAYATDLSGVPQIPSLQTLNVSSISQLNIHPSGKFVYGMQLENLTGAYISQILLFHIRVSGRLQIDPQVQGIYGPAAFPTLLYGVSPDGSQVYLASQDGNGPAYWESAVNGQDGTLAPVNLLFRPPVRDSTILGAKLAIEYQNVLDYLGPGYVNVLSNEPEPPQQLIHCAGAMLSACGTASNVQIDPSGKYLFLTDPVSRQVRVGLIDFPANAIADTGNFLPLTAQTPGFAFSPDGTLVYAWLASDRSLHIYRFDRTSGNLTDGGRSIALPNSAGFSPALRQ
jgi:DNA-binding beta-propeller fold protein YncE